MINIVRRKIRKGLNLYDKKTKKPLTYNDDIRSSLTEAFFDMDEIDQELLQLINIFRTRSTPKTKHFPRKT